MLLQGQLINRQTVDIGDIIRQLRRRRPSIPIEREGDLSFMPPSFAVCFLDRHGAPSLNNYSPPRPDGPDAPFYSFLILSTLARPPIPPTTPVTTPASL